MTMMRRLDKLSLVPLLCWLILLTTSAQADNLKEKKQNTAEALQSLKRAIEYGKQGNKEGVEAECNKAVGKDPDSLAILLPAAKIFAFLGNHNRALELIDRSILLTKSKQTANARLIAELYVNRGNVNHQAGRIQASIDDYKIAIEYDPFVGHRARAYVRTQQRNYKGAVEDYTEALKYKEDDELYRQRGTARYTIREVDEAVKDFSRALQLNPKNAGAYARRGDARVRLKDYKGALDDFNRAIKLEPDNAITYVGRAIAKAEMNDRKGALEDFERSLKLDENSSVYLCRSEYLAKWGDSSEAIADLDKVVQARPEESAVYAERSKLKLLRGDFFGAQDDFAKSIGIQIQDQLKATPKY
jgi:tetratricopeptide (TPR) repeat protein